MLLSNLAVYEILDSLIKNKKKLTAILTIDWLNHTAILWLFYYHYEILCLTLSTLETY